MTEWGCIIKLVQPLFLFNPNRSLEAKLISTNNLFLLA